MFRYLLVIFLLTFLNACGQGSSNTNGLTPIPPPQPDPVPGFGTVPRLGNGPHLGMITGFDILTTEPYDRPLRVAELTNQAITAGMNISRFQIDWNELETEPGLYDMDEMNALLDSIAETPLPAYITLSSLDSGELTFPDYLMDGDSLRSDLTVGSAEVTEAFERFLDWFVPHLSGASVWGLSIGNEGDSLLDDEVIEPDDFVSFFLAGLAKVNALDAEMSSSVTFTSTAYSHYPTEMQAILAESDHVTINYYCLDKALLVTQQTSWEAFINEIKQDVGNKIIFFQELGCPVGYGDGGAGAPVRPPSLIDGDPATQARFITYFSQLFISDPQFIGATWFQLLDWSPELAQAYSAPILDDNRLAGERTEEWLATSGLCRWADGTCRLGWEEWLQMLEDTSRERARR